MVKKFLRLVDEFALKISLGLSIDNYCVIVCCNATYIIFHYIICHNVTSVEVYIELLTVL